MKTFNDYLYQVNEKSFKDYAYQLYHSKDGMRTAKGFNTKEEALKYALAENIGQFDIFRNGVGFHSTTQDEFLVLWADKDDNGYFANRSKKEPELLKKKYEIKETVAEAVENTLPQTLKDIKKIMRKASNDKSTGMYGLFATSNGWGYFQFPQNDEIWLADGYMNIMSTGDSSDMIARVNKFLNPYGWEMVKGESQRSVNIKKLAVTNEAGELVPVQAGEVIKLQKPAQETFTNNTLNNDGVEIADCTVCGATGVLVKDHICKTVIEPMAQVDSEYNMVETLITKERFSSLRAKYGVNENKMVTKIDWLKAILESPNDNSKRSEDSKSDIRMTPEEIATEVQRLFDRYNSEDLMTDIQNMFPDFNTTEAEDATNHVLDTIYDSETITDQKWLSIKPDLFTKFKHFFETTTLG